MKLFLSITLLLLNSITFAQNKEVASTSMPKIGAYPDKDVVVYKNALSLGDLETATNALHYIIAANPNGAIYKDTLALLYLQRGYYRQAQVLTMPLYQEKENETRTEVLAICAKQLGQQIEAIDLYKKLYRTTKNNNYAFEQLQLEYDIKRLTESKLTAEALLLALPSDDKTKLTVQKLDNKTVQQISLKAGIYYILGTIYFDMNDRVQALQQFEKAIALQPDYDLALQAIQLLTKKDEVENNTKKKK
ncbi:tetratricopeptide repeat protein [Flavobacterium ponti]|uniref:Tetratricopeptide repeat protein n=1 Tax=Flavobacterium ponti TaxID=665133 RepID=A0ABV9P324_9FLAO